MSLFGRQCVVYVDTLRVEGLDVEFTVELDAANLGKAEIKIYNLNGTHRKRLEDSKSVDVELLAGYSGHALDRLFLGTLRDVFSEHVDTDWVTTLRSGDGDKAGSVRINRSYTPGTSYSQMWKDVVGTFRDKISPGNALKAFGSGDFLGGIEQALHGDVLQGDAMKELRRLATKAGLEFSIQDNEFVVVPIGQALATSAIVLSPNTGLIGSPKKAPKGELRVKALIVPGLRPRRQVDIRSEQAHGMYVVRKCKYTADTAGGDWYAELVCKEL